MGKKKASSSKSGSLDGLYPSPATTSPASTSSVTTGAKAYLSKLVHRSPSSPTRVLAPNGLSYDQYTPSDKPHQRSPSRSSSLISFASTASVGPQSTAYDTPSVIQSTARAHPVGWRGLDTPLPLPSHLAAARAPTDAFDLDPSWVPHPSDPHSLRHSEYGYDVNPAHRATSRHIPGTSLQAVEDEPSVWVYLATYISWGILILMGHVRDFFGKRIYPGQFAHLRPHGGYAPLFSDFDSFYSRRAKTRLDDCFSRPITGVASRTATLLDRTSTDHYLSFTFTGETTQALNISSYNYLGFAQSRGPCAEVAEACLRGWGVSSCGARLDGGNTDLHVQCERLVARFLGTEDAMTISQGFATNSTTLPALVGKGSLIISDELNHSSIRFGARLSGAMVRQYKHNDMADLEQLLREVISQGQPRTHRPWKKILLVVEGLYSMEGTLVDLPTVMALKEKYKFALYIDEAHSIGALGPRGAGVCDYFSIDPRQVDILMGTFTKSFGAAGGYIAGSANTIRALRRHVHSQMYAESMAPAVVGQILASMGSIMGPEALTVAPVLRRLPEHAMSGADGKDRLQRLAFNCRYLSDGLRRMGFIVYGHRDSPIVPVLLFQPGKMSAFGRLMLERHKIVVVVVSYPATPLTTSRVRFCVSAAHTKTDLDRVLLACEDVGSILGLMNSPQPLRVGVHEVIRTGVESVRKMSEESEMVEYEDDGMEAIMEEDESIKSGKGMRLVANE